MDYPYKIPYSAAKTYLNAVVGVLITAACLYNLPLVFANFTWLTVLLGICSLIGIILFGYGTIASIQMLYSGKLAIEVDDEGIRDETSKIAVGLVKWKDITGFREYSLAGSKFILVDVRDPKEYYDRARGGIAKNLMKRNEDKTGTPITLNLGNVKIKSAELIELLRAELAFNRSLYDSPGTPLPELIALRERLLGL